MRRLAALEPAEAARALDALVERSRQSLKARQALAVASRALTSTTSAPMAEEQRRRIYDAAVELELTAVAALFVQGPAAKTVSADAPEVVDPTLAELSVGHKKMYARRPDPDRMDRLAMEGDPRVIRELLLNPRMTEASVVRLVARRPVKAEVLFEVWRSPRWSVRPGVRKALAMNPYTPPDIGLKILPHLLVTDLREVALDGSLHADVRELARVLSERRTRR